MASENSSPKKSKEEPQNPETDLKEFIEKKKIQNEALRKIIEKLNTTSNKD